MVCAVVAQIIPVFLLVLAVGQSRMQPRESKFDLGFLAAVLAPVAIILLGELCALRVLMGGSETEFLRDMAAVSVALALGTLVMRLVHSLLSDFDPDAVAEDRPPQHFWLIGVLGALVAFGSSAFLLVGT